MRLLKKWLSSLNLLLLVLPLNACVQEPEWKTIYLKMGANVLEWQAMQTEWQPNLKEWAYASSPEIWGNLKVYLEKDLWLDIPYADANLVIANGRIFSMHITSWTKERRREMNPQIVKNLVDQVNQTLQKSTTWQSTPMPKTFSDYKKWINKTDDLVHGNISVDIFVGNREGELRKNWLVLQYSSPFSSCFGGLNSHVSAFEGRFTPNFHPPTPRELSQYLHRLGGSNITALEIMGTDDPKKLPLKEYLRRVDLYMERVCPELLDKYGRFQG